MTTQKSARRKGLYYYPKKIIPKVANWYYKGEDGCEKALYTTIGSGAMGRTEGFEHHRGDIAPLADWGSEVPWLITVELKHRKEWSWKDLIVNYSKSFLAEYWAQAVIDGEDGNGNKIREPYLIFTKNYEKDYIMYSRSSGYKSLIYSKIWAESITADFMIGGEVGICVLDTFLKYVDPDDVIDYMKLRLSEIETD